MILILRVFHISIRWICTQWLSRFALGLKHSFDFLARVLGVPFINNIKKWCKITFLLIGTVNSIVDGNKSDFSFRKSNLRVITYLEIISTESAHIFYNNRCNMTCVHFCYHSLKTRSVKGCATYSVIDKKFSVSKSVIISVFF